MPGTKTNARAHRYAYELAYGPIAEGLVIDHLCRNKPCVRPDHLEAVTNAENIRRGKNAKVSDKTAREILALKGLEFQRHIAERFGVKRSLVADIHAGRTWVAA